MTCLSFVLKHVLFTQEKQTKLWHTPYYDNEFKLKQLYIKICKNLPAYNCKLYNVKELRGNSSKKVMTQCCMVSVSTDLW